MSPGRLRTVRLGAGVVRAGDCMDNRVPDDATDLREVPRFVAAARLAQHDALALSGVFEHVEQHGDAGRRAP